MTAVTAKKDAMDEVLTETWCREAIDALNADPDAPGASSGWSFDFGVVIEGAGGGRAVYLGPPVAGRVPRPEFMSVEALAERQPSYFAAASEATWVALVRGEVDPIAAVVERRLVVRGDLAPVAARLRYKGLAQRWREALAGRLERAATTGRDGDGAACEPRPLVTPSPP